MGNPLTFIREETPVILLSEIAILGLTVDVNGELLVALKLKFGQMQSGLAEETDKMEGRFAVLAET